MSIARFLGKLWMLLFGDTLLAVGAVLSLCLIGAGISGKTVSMIQLDGTGERFFGILTGVLMMLGCAGSLALAHVKRFSETVRFFLQIAVRIAFILLGPMAAATAYFDFMNGAGIWPFVLLPCCTVLPFGLSLVLLILKKRNSHS